MPVKCWQTIVRFWLFLSYLITTVSICFCLSHSCFLCEQLLSSAHAWNHKCERIDWALQKKIESIKTILWNGTVSYRNFLKPLATLCPRFISIDFMEITSLFVFEYKIVFENRYNLRVYKQFWVLTAQISMKWFF